MAPLIVAFLAFVSVALVIFVGGQFVLTQATVRRRLNLGVSTPQGALLPENVRRNFLYLLADQVDEKTFGIEGTLRSKLRRDLLRAGYFSDEAIRFYVVARLALVLVVPTSVYVLLQLTPNEFNLPLKLLFVGVAAAVSILGVDAYISRRQKSREQEYRTIFPDLIDMLVVCVDAGLSLDVAFSRIYPEIAKRSRALGMNLAILGAETRAGRSMVDALDGFADRLNLDEATAFVIMLRQSIELGTDIGETLRVFSDEMRGKRLLRAEETANKLPVKMVIPIGLCIFPVILMVVMIPVMIKLFTVMKIVG